MLVSFQLKVVQPLGILFLIIQGEEDCYVQNILLLQQKSLLKILSSIKDNLIRT